MDMTTPMQPKPLVNATCKLGEKGCFKDGRCHALGDCENKIVTNADKIRAMTDEEFADWLARTQIANVAEALSIAGFPWGMDSELHDATKMECLEWLKQPVEESHG